MNQSVQGASEDRTRAVAEGLLIKDTIRAVQQRGAAHYSQARPYWIGDVPQAHQAEEDLFYREAFASTSIYSDAFEFDPLKSSDCDRPAAAHAYVTGRVEGKRDQLAACGGVEAGYRQSDESKAAWDERWERCWEVWRPRGPRMEDFATHEEYMEAYNLDMCQRLPQTRPADWKKKVWEGWLDRCPALVGQDWTERPRK